MAYDVTLDTVERQLIGAARQRTTSKGIAKEIGDLLSHGVTAADRALKDIGKAQPESMNGVLNAAVCWVLGGRALG